MSMHQLPVGSSWEIEAGKATVSVASTPTAEGPVQGLAGYLKQGAWLFAVDDGEEGIVISGEYSDDDERNYLRLVRMAEPTNSSTYATAFDDAPAIRASGPFEIYSEISDTFGAKMRVDRITFA